jgi:hypothetical protein
MLDSGWLALTSLVSGLERVSIGTVLGASLTMKQSSMSGSCAPSVNALLPSTLLNGLGPPVGMPPSSTGR